MESERLEGKGVEDEMGFREGWNTASLMRGREAGWLVTEHLLLANKEPGLIPRML